MEEKIKKFLDKKIKPMLEFHGGDVEFVDFQKGVLKVKLKGACVGCPMSEMTLKQGIEKQIQGKIPEVKKVEAIKED